MGVMGKMSGIGKADQAAKMGSIGSEEARDE